MKKLYGWEFFEKLAANNPRIGRSAGDPITLLNAGECLVGVGAAGGAYPAEDKGNPIGINHPTDGLVLCVGPSAIPANAPHPNAAKLFLDWLLSDTSRALPPATAPNRCAPACHRVRGSRHWPASRSFR